MADPFTSIATAMSLGTRAYELSKNIGNLELKEAIVDLRSELVSLKVQLVDLREEVDRLEAENKKLKEPSEVMISNGVYIVDGREGEFCTACYDDLGKLILLADTPLIQRSVARVRCPKCKVNYQ